VLEGEQLAGEIDGGAARFFLHRNFVADKAADSQRGQRFLSDRDSLTAPPLMAAM
jgi:hypothetical protein